MSYTSVSKIENYYSYLLKIVITWEISFFSLVVMRCLDTGGYWFDLSLYLF